MKASARPLLAIAALVSLAHAAPARAGSFDQSFAFELDKWYALESQEGPVTLHRIQIARQRGLITKSTVFRPGNQEFLSSVEIRLEYSNTATHDWKAKLKLAWLDADGKEIDGYDGSEDLDEKESHELVTIKLATIRYGLERAKKLRVVIEYRPE
jgi:hypothetical protein